jgi:CheY-like chemotaxis protein
MVANYPELVMDGYARFPRTWRTLRGPRSAVSTEKGQDGRYSRAANEPYLSSGMETITETLERSVLVVDDEPQVVWVLQYSLEAEGYTTLSARDGAAALEAVDLFHPRLMLLDIMMPTLDGWSVLEEIGRLPDAKRPRVVVVSALSSLRDRARAAELGADAFCPKPFNVEDLIGVVRDLEDLDDLDVFSDFDVS